MCGVCGSVSGITRRLSKIKDKGFSSRNPNCADLPTALRDFYELPDHGEAREDATIEVVGEQTEEESTREALHDVTLRKSTGSLDGFVAKFHSPVFSATFVRRVGRRAADRVQMEPLC